MRRRRRPWPTRCALCGADPAPGRAMLNGSRYCHPDGAEQSCYVMAHYAAAAGMVALLREQGEALGIPAEALEEGERKLSNLADLFAGTVNDPVGREAGMLAEGWEPMALCRRCRTFYDAAEPHDCEVAE